MEESPSICICQNYEDIVKLTKNDKIGFILSFEGAEPLVNDINLLDIFYKLGVRGLGLTHSQRNLAADGAPIIQGRLKGLEDFQSLESNSSKGQAAWGCLWMSVI